MVYDIGGLDLRWAVAQETKTTFQDVFIYLFILLNEFCSS
jgi:hypothetical protein